MNSIRTCIVTREKLLKDKLIRLSINSEGEIVVNISEDEGGRGVYIKPYLEILEQAIKKNKIPFSLKLNRKLTNEEIENLKTNFHRKIEVSKL